MNLKLLPWFEHSAMAYYRSLEGPNDNNASLNMSWLSSIHCLTTYIVKWLRFTIPLELDFQDLRLLRAARPTFSHSTGIPSIVLWLLWRSPHQRLASSIQHGSSIWRLPWFFKIGLGSPDVNFSMFYNYKYWNTWATLKVNTSITPLLYTQQP